MSVLQNNLSWTEEQLITGKIVIENWLTPDQMTAKPFFWSSCGIETPADTSLEEAIKALPNRKAISAMAQLVLKYGVPKDEWPKGQYSAPEPLSEEIARALGVDVKTATRTDVLAAAKNAGRIDLFDDYNVGYNKGLATQHTCAYILNCDGTVTEL